MRLRVPPREIASAVRLRAVGRAGWALAAALLILHAIITVDLLVAAGRSGEAWGPVLAIAIQFTAVVVLFLRPGSATGVLFLLCGAFAVYGYTLSTSGTIPTVGVDGFSRPDYLAISLCLVGPVTRTPLSGIWWSTAGFLISQVAAVAAVVTVGVPVRFVWTSTVMWLLCVLIYFALWRDGRIQQRMVPDLSGIQASSDRYRAEQDAETLAVAIVHETVLSDLSLIAHSTEVLSDDDRERLRNNLEVISRDTGKPAGHTVEVSSLEDDFYRAVSEFQWRGLTVEVSGATEALDLLAVHSRYAMLGAIRAALENVLEHSGKTSVDVFIDQGDDRLTVMVVDEGQGFDLSEVEADRLGIRVTITRRIENHGGSVDIWSSPHVGTSVVITLPLGRERVAHEA